MESSYQHFMSKRPFIDSHGKRGQPKLDIKNNNKIITWEIKNERLFLTLRNKEKIISISRKDAKNLADWIYEHG